MISIRTLIFTFALGMMYSKGNNMKLWLSKLIHFNNMKMWLIKLIHEMTACSTRRTIVQPEKTQPKMHYMLKAFKKIRVWDMPVVMVEQGNEEDPPTYVITGTNIKYGDRPTIEFDFDIEHFKTPDDIWVCSEQVSDTLYDMGMFDLGKFKIVNNTRDGPLSQRTADVEYFWKHPYYMVFKDDPSEVTNRHYTIKARLNSKTFVVFYLRVEP